MNITTFDDEASNNFTSGSASYTGQYRPYDGSLSVFDGEKGCYNENDIPNPINVYSKSKFEAEKIVEEYE